jgi:DNA-binding NarL/FixJ family response regulator
VLSGKKYLTAEVVHVLADAFEHNGTGRNIANLSERELEVFKMLASGKTISDIARTLSLSANTISTFRSRVFEKMDFRTNLELIKYAFDI